MEKFAIQFIPHRFSSSPVSYFIISRFFYYILFLVCCFAVCYCFSISLPSLNRSPFLIPIGAILSLVAIFFVSSINRRFIKISNQAISTIVFVPDTFAPLFIDQGLLATPTEHYSVAAVCGINQLCR